MNIEIPSADETNEWEKRTKPLTKTCRLVDNREVDSMEEKMSNGATPRKIIGVSMTPELAKKVKKEAAMREISIRKLFEEMWELYTKNRKN